MTEEGTGLVPAFVKSFVMVRAWLNGSLALPHAVSLLVFAAVCVARSRACERSKTSAAGLAGAPAPLCSSVSQSAHETGQSAACTSCMRPLMC